MKALLAITSAAFGILLASCERQAGQKDQVDRTEQSDPPTTTNTDHDAVFKRAFWKRPTEGDEILHAERREWIDSEGVSAWQWFIEVKPSPELLKHLRDDNAFSLVAADPTGPPEDSPAWFAFDPGEVTVLNSPQGNMSLYFKNQESTLYATDEGGGFQRGAPEPASPVQSSQAPGRIPTTSPPAPQP